MVDLRPPRASRSRTYSSTSAPGRKYLTPAASRLNAQLQTNSISTRKKQQPTLTQIDFVCNDESDNDGHQSHQDENCRFESDYDEYETAQERNPQSKRRKVSRVLTEAERKRQQTLTQMHGFLTHQVDDSEDEGVFQLDSESEDRGQNQDENWHDSFLDNAGAENEDQEQNGGDTHAMRSPNDQTKDLMSTHKPVKPTACPSQTSHGLPRAEIPSSQTPTGSPLSTGNPSSQAKQVVRTPLREIHPNVLAMRDSISASSEKTSAKRKHSSVGSNQIDEECLSDNENYMPDLDDDVEDELETESPTKVIRRIDFCKAVGRTSASPTNLRSRSTKAIGHNPKSPDKTFQQTIRSSQATTVDDDTPQSKHRMSPLRRSSLPRSADDEHETEEGVPSSSPPTPPPSSKIDRTKPMTIDSQLPTSPFTKVAQIASINHSADIITFSQMIPDSSPQEDP